MRTDKCTRQKMAKQSREVRASNDIEFRQDLAFLPLGTWRADLSPCTAFILVIRETVRPPTRLTSEDTRGDFFHSYPLSPRRISRVRSGVC